MVARLLLGVLPTRGEAIVAFNPPGTEISGEVNCGTIFSDTNADGCEGPLISRLGAMVMALVAAVVFGGAGLVILLLQARWGR